jgi:hypothetical protein
MSDRTKRILLIVGFILVVILIGLAIYYVFFKPIISPAPVNVNVNALPINGPGLNVPPTNVPIININVPVVPITNGNIPPISPIIPGPTISDHAIGGITSFSTLESDNTTGLNFASNGQDMNYLDKNTGIFYTLKPNGEKLKLSDMNFTNVSNVVWSPNSQKAVIEYADGSKIIYDFTQKKYITLPSQWKDFSFSLDGKQIAFKDMKLDPEDRYISVADTNGGNYIQIERIGSKDADVYVDWSPNNSYVALYRESIDSDRSEVYPIGLNGENFTSFRIEGRDPRFEYSPSGNSLLYSAYNINSDYKPTLWIVSTNPSTLGTGRDKIQLDTWADKCSFASDTIVYCAVPKNLDTGAGFRPDLADSTSDQFYKIDLTTNTKQIIAQPLYPTTVNNLIVSPDGKSLIWTEKISGEIKKMSL